MYNIIENIQKKLPISKSRFERKIKVNKNQIIFLREFFYGIGFFKKYPDKKIKSIYFDDENLSFAKANINGELYRIKPRLRWYNDDTNKINHEFKIKIGFNSYKSITDKFFLKDASLKDNIKLTKKFYDEDFDLNLRETISISYNRTYLEHVSGVRLTIDQNIFSKETSKNKFYSMPYEVLEFKYNNILDNYFREYLFKKLSHLPLRMTKCSKYIECLMKLL